MIKMICNFCGVELNDSFCDYCGNDNEIMVVSELIFEQLQQNQNFNEYKDIKKGYIGTLFINGKIKRVVVLK